ncbi:helix-turn-helix transcriptional regulator [Aureliella helgolandensis]|uniref:helix-turn-helix transcriptional regulator n=1 Tax=Aureliella helgolandensis TaxID=2527968 RepID=UPI0018D11F0A|nr:LuxR C-terminal-related transcriptional regulator [Aureliella helgolandensis]
MVGNVDKVAVLDGPPQPGSSLADEGVQLVRAIASAVTSLSDLRSVIEPSQNCVYIKSADGQILFTNSNHDRVFGSGATSTGRYSKTFLDETVVPVSEHSDRLITNGCAFVQFQNPGRDSNGQIVLLQTVKFSLLGIGHPKLAILGVTEILEVAEQEPSKRVLSLSRSWHIFTQLDERDRKCAAMFAHGEKTKAIAEKFGVTDKTIDNRRVGILKAFGLNNTMELTRLLCRLQDNGFCDLGL